MHLVHPYYDMTQYVCVCIIYHYDFFCRRSRCLLIWMSYPKRSKVSWWTISACSVSAPRRVLKGLTSMSSKSSFFFHASYLVESNHTHGTVWNVLIKGGVLNSGVVFCFFFNNYVAGICMHGVLINRRCPHFRGVLIEGIPLYIICYELQIWQLFRAR